MISIKFNIKPTIKPLTGELLKVDIEESDYEDVETRGLDLDKQCPAGYDWETVKAKTNWFRETPP